MKTTFKGTFAFVITLLAIQMLPAQNESFSIEMIHVEGGIFKMGAAKEHRKDAEDNELPAHRVKLSSYFIGKYEVTQLQWKQVMGSNPSHFRGDDLPVECVSWDEVQEFIRKLNAMTGMKYRLPTEAEWEYAARGGNKSRGYKYSGSNAIDSIAWYHGNSHEETHPVGSKSPNELGIYDMSGNVYEWCADNSYNAYTATFQVNPTGSTPGQYRVLRGGSWDVGAAYCRVSYRYGVVPGLRYNSCGFRLAL